MTLARLAEQAVRAALAEGASDAEAYAWDAAELQASKIGVDASLKESRTSGLGVRAVRGGALGFASATPARPAEAERAARQAARLASLLPRTGATLPEVARGATRGPGYDAALAALTPRDAGAWAEAALREARAGKRGAVAFASATVQRSRWRFALASSRGVRAAQRGVRASIEVECRVRDGARERTGMATRVARAGFAPRGVGRDARWRAEAMLGARRPRVLASEVVLDAEAALLLPQLLAPALTGAYVAEGRSILARRQGERIASPILTVRDGPGQGGMAAQAVDDEGTPGRDRALVEAGVLKGFVLDHASAAKLGAASTGNGLRGGGDQRHRVPPAPLPMGLAVQPGKGDLEDLLARVDRGVLVRWQLMGLANINATTGDFSVVAPCAFLIRRGAVAHPLPPTTITGNLLGALQGLQQVGAAPREPGLRLPPLRVAGLTCAA
ncbi:MAG TPA: metallopeptidase TldD-related protein [Candidatus Thermoplasmatota archaeon]|jgi:PmbA protein|nr:metallopeptidase TldD-related protein [Candidatus Thermoplasmatota archaeon]